MMPSSPGNFPFSPGEGEELSLPPEEDRKPVPLTPASLQEGEKKRYACSGRVTKIRLRCRKKSPPPFPGEGTSIFLFGAA